MPCPSSCWALQGSGCFPSSQAPLALLPPNSAFFLLSTFWSSVGVGHRPMAASASVEGPGCIPTCMKRWHLQNGGRGHLVVTCPTPWGHSQCCPPTFSPPPDLSLPRTLNKVTTEWERGGTGCAAPAPVEDGELPSMATRGRKVWSVEGQGPSILGMLAQRGHGEPVIQQIRGQNYMSRPSWVFIGAPNKLRVQVLRKELDATSPH